MAVKLASSLLLCAALALLVAQLAHGEPDHQHYSFVIEEANYTRLCHTRSILTVNGQLPGPTVYARKGEIVFVHVQNRGYKNITIHWHGVDQPRNPWSDGPAYITQCPIQPGGNFTYRVHFTEEEGTLWWHAHTDYDRTTVYGAIVVRPAIGTTYPFPEPHADIPIILGEWFNVDINAIYQKEVRTGGGIPLSDANTINGQPGDLAPCTNNGTFTISVERGKTYLLRVINAAVDNVFFVGVAGHSLTVVGSDAAYLKPFTVDYIGIYPGQTMDVLLKANALAGGRFYLAASTFQDSSFGVFKKTVATAIVEYAGANASSTDPPKMPVLPGVTNTTAMADYQLRLRSLNNADHPVNVPKCADRRILITIAMGKLPCPTGQVCDGLNGTRLASSLNNVSFGSPDISILEAYYNSIRGVYEPNFPNKPTFFFNFTAPSEDQPSDWLFTNRATKVKVVEYGTNLEIVLQSTSLLGAQSHPLHIHGHSVYLVGHGEGNYDPKKATEYEKTYNLIDPPYVETIPVPSGGWAAFRFQANNPGVWFMHCHFDRHLAWGMETVFVVKDGPRPNTGILPPPKDMPLCIAKETASAELDLPEKEEDEEFES